MTFVLELTPDGTNLVVTGEWSTAAVRALEKGEADGLTLNYARGFQEPDLKFLTGLPVRRLTILDRSLTDLSPIYGLSESLVSLVMESEPRAMLDLGRLPHLIILAARWNQVVDSIRSVPQLESLGVLAFREPDLTALGFLTSLTSLRVGDRPRVRSLDGIESMTRLAELIVTSPPLEDITALQRLAPPVLKDVSFESAKRIEDIGPVGFCPSLERFNLSEGGQIDSVRPLEELVHLEYVHMWGSTKIEDGDLSPIGNLPRLRELRMMNRRSYSPSVLAIQEQIEKRKAS